MNTLFVKTSKGIIRADAINLIQEDREKNTVTIYVVDSPQIHLSGAEADEFMSLFRMRGRVKNRDDYDEATVGIYWSTTLFA